MATTHHHHWRYKMEDPNFTRMSPDFKKRYRKMIEQHNKEQEQKKKNKSKLEKFAETLYGGTK